MNSFFRAYSIHEKKWLDPEELVYCNGEWFKDWHDMVNGMPFPENNFKVMRSLGERTDINGKQVFAGDIVNLTSESPHYKNHFSFVIIQEDEAFCAFDGALRVYAWQDYDIEIIGNIYDNPELLEPTK